MNRRAFLLALAAVPVALAIPPPRGTVGVGAVVNGRLVIRIAADLRQLKIALAEGEAAVRRAHASLARLTP